MHGKAKDKILHRLKIIRGHLDKVVKMVEEDEYCLGILQQSTAVSSALKKVDQEILENHLKTCVRDSLISKESVDEKVDEIVKVFRARIG